MGNHEMTSMNKRLQKTLQSIADKELSRRRLVTTAGRYVLSAGAFSTIGGLGACAKPPVNQHQEPRITRIKMGTIGTTDLQIVQDWYTNWLGYSVAERGQVSAPLAASWGTPNMAGRPYILMRPESGEDVFIRAAGIDDVAGYRPLTTFGWNSFEIIVDDVYALYERLKKGPFEIIGSPQSLGGDFASIHAMQVIGPSKEVLYLTCETGARDKSLLPDPGAFVGRIFILVVSGPDVSTIQEFYTSRFALTAGPPSEIAIELIARAQGLPADHRYPLRFMALKERGNFLEIDGYPEITGPRPRSAGGLLPPGNALASFSVNALDELDIEFISRPIQETSMAYGGHRSATFIGPAGEVVELIEEPR
jgi:catechol 2,3-dioxygenase-like lactoylglutathione lyase family enzyme